MELNKMSEISQLVEEKENRIDDLEGMNFDLTRNLNEYINVISDAAEKLKGINQVIKQNEDEIDQLKLNLEQYEALRQ